MTVKLQSTWNIICGWRCRWVKGRFDEYPAERARLFVAIYIGVDTMVEGIVANKNCYIYVNTIYL